MKYLSTAILMACSFATMSQAYGEDATQAKNYCNGVVDVVTGLACAGQATEKALAPPVKAVIREGKILVRAGEDIVVDDGRVVGHALHKVGSDLGKPWKNDFKNLEEEKNQDAAHAVGDFAEATGQDIGKISKGLWRGISGIGHGVKTESVKIIDAEASGFVGRKPVDVVSAVADLSKGTAQVFVVLYHDAKYLVRTVGNHFADPIRIESDNQNVRDYIAKAKTEKFDLLPAPELPLAAQTLRSDAKPLEPQAFGQPKSPAGQDPGDRSIAGCMNENCDPSVKN